VGCLGVFFQSEARGCVMGKQVQAVVSGLVHIHIRLSSYLLVKTKK